MLKPLMVHIPQGTIQLRDDRKQTTWSTQLDAYLMSKYPITQEMYTYLMGNNPSVFKGTHRPVESVSWLDAIDFCNALSRACELEDYYDVVSGHEVKVSPKHNDGYRLPTDAEWEYACRADSGKVQYGPIDQIAWYAENSNDSTQDVGMKQPNAFGLHDMLGNVWEWCWDVYDAEVYGSYRVFRGGGWADRSRGCLASNRRRSHPTYAIDDLGFRVARSM